MAMMHLAVYLGLLIGAAACNKQGADSTGKSAAANAAGSGSANNTPISGKTTSFLTMADITPGATLETKTGAEIVASIASESSIYANQPKSKSTCVEDLITAQGAITASKTGMVVDVTFDIGSCLLESLKKTSTTNAPVYSVAKSPMHVHAVYNCQVGDLSSLNGQNYKVLDTMNLQTLCPTLAGFVETDATEVMSYVVTGTDGTKAQGSFNIHAVSFAGGPNLTPCTYTQVSGIITTTNGCQSVNRSTTTSVANNAPQPNSESYSLYTYNGMTRPSDVTTVWFTTGSINVVNDQWTGTLTYAGGKAPTYQLSNKLAAPVTGTLVATDSDGDAALVDQIMTPAATIQNSVQQLMAGFRH